MPADELRVSRRLKLDKDHSQVTRSMEIWARNMQGTFSKLPASSGKRIRFDLWSIDCRGGIDSALQ